MSGWQAFLGNRLLCQKNRFHPGCPELCYVKCIVLSGSRAFCWAEASRWAKPGQRRNVLLRHRGVVSHTGRHRLRGSPRRCAAQGAWCHHGCTTPSLHCKPMIRTFAMILGAMLLGAVILGIYAIMLRP